MKLIRHLGNGCRDDGLVEGYKNDGKQNREEDEGELGTGRILDLNFLLLVLQARVLFGEGAIEERVHGSVLLIHDAAGFGLILAAIVGVRDGGVETGCVRRQGLRGWFWMNVRHFGRTVFVEIVSEEGVWLEHKAPV